MTTHDRPKVIQLRPHVASEAPPRMPWGEWMFLLLAGIVLGGAAWLWIFLTGQP